MLTIQADNISIEVQFKAIKRINLSIYPPDGRVRLSAPLGTNLKVLHDFAQQKNAWITKQQNKIKNRKREPEKHYIDGEMHGYKGELYCLNIEYVTAKPKVLITPTHLTLCVRSHYTKEQRKKILQGWYREHLKEEILVLIQKYEHKMNVSVKEFGVKQMRTRWGTCNPIAQRIWLNLELIKKPLISLEYVVVHEMVHLLEASHNSRFKALMDRFLPNWRCYKKQLNQETSYL